MNLKWKVDFKDTHMEHTSSDRSALYTPFYFF